MPPLQAHAALPVPLPPIWRARAGACPRATPWSYYALWLWLLLIPKSRITGRFAGIDECATCSIGNVILTARTVVDGILSNTCNPALQGDQLPTQGQIIQ